MRGVSGSSMDTWSPLHWAGYQREEIVLGRVSWYVGNGAEGGEEVVDVVNFRKKYNRILIRCSCPDCGSSRFPYWRREKGIHSWSYVRCTDCDIILTPFMWLRLNGWVLCGQCHKWTLPKDFEEGVWKCSCGYWCGRPLTDLVEIVRILWVERVRDRLMSPGSPPNITDRLEAFGLEISVNGGGA